VTKEITGLALQGREEISNTPSPLMGFVRISNVTFTLLSRLYLFYFYLTLKGQVYCPVVNTFHTGFI